MKDKTKYKILQPKDTKLIINEKILVHFFNYVIEHRINNHLNEIDVIHYNNESDWGISGLHYFTEFLRDNELQNWKIQLIEDLLKGKLDKDNE